MKKVGTMAFLPLFPKFTVKNINCGTVWDNSVWDPIFFSMWDAVKYWNRLPFCSKETQVLH